MEDFSSHHVLIQGKITEWGIIMPCFKEKFPNLKANFYSFISLNSIFLLSGKDGDEKVFFQRKITPD
jgi:hypothetical protein